MAVLGAHVHGAKDRRGNNCRLSLCERCGLRRAKGNNATAIDPPTLAQGRVLCEYHRLTIETEGSLDWRGLGIDSIAPKSTHHFGPMPLEYCVAMNSWVAEISGRTRDASSEKKRAKVLHLASLACDYEVPLGVLPPRAGRASGKSHDSLLLRRLRHGYVHCRVPRERRIASHFSYDRRLPEKPTDVTVRHAIV